MTSVPCPDSPDSWTPAPIARHPALLAAACVCIGVFLGDATDVASGVFLLATLLLGLIGVVASVSGIRTNRVIGVLSITLALVGLGAWRIAVTNTGRPSPSLTELMTAERSVSLFARVDGVPFQKSSGWRVPLDLISVKSESGDIPVEGNVLLTSITSLHDVRHGDYIRFDGRVFAPSTRRNSGGFDYAEYLHRQGFDATVRPESHVTKWQREGQLSLYNLADPVRRWIRETFTEHLEVGSQALLAGLLLGDTDRLPRPVYEAFRESGTSHLLAVSGANVWLVVGMLLLPMYALSVPRWPRTVIALVVIVFFSFLTRNEPSVVRASLMVGLILMGRLLWRPVAPLNAVGAAALIILILSPAQLFRPGFQLSFAAVIGILVAVGRFEPMLKGFWRKRLSYSFVLFLVASLAATFATAPITAWHFGTVPVAGLISNLIMVPLAGVTAHLGLALLPLQAVTSTGTRGLTWAIDHLLRLAVNTADFFANMPWATISWPSPSPLVLGHIILAVVLILNWRHRYSWFKPIVIYSCICLAAIAVSRVITTEPITTSISLLDTSRQRVAILAAGTDPPIGIIDDPGLDDDLEQWVVQPFLRHEFGVRRLDFWNSWRRLDDVPADQDDNTGPLTRPWKRVYSTDESDSLGRPRVWADLWRTDSADIFMFRDVPNVPLTRIFEAVGHTLRAATVILPSQARIDWVREVVDRSKPKNVILYGSPQFRQDPSETVSFWRLRFPEVEFYSTAVNGGLTLEFYPDQVSLVPTVTSSRSEAE